MSIDPKKFYTPAEIARNGFILSRRGEKSVRHVRRLCQHNKLKSEEVLAFGDNVPRYKILGADIIAYKQRKESERQAKLAKKPRLQPQM